MTKIVLFHCPRTCSQVTVCALEEAGLSYELKLVNILAGDQLKPEFLAISPLNKVPAALIDGRPLTENAAIITFVARSAPRSSVLPGPEASAWLQAEAQSGLSFCAGTLHPQVRGLIAPQRLTEGDQLEPIRAKAAELAHQSFAYADNRMRQEGWWLGSWSIVDVYLNWAFRAALRGGFDGSRYSALLALSERLAEEKPSFRKMTEIDSDLLRSLAL